MSPWWLGLAGTAAWLLLNHGIRRSLAPDRVVGQGDPGPLPWQTVDVATANSKRLFAWFIPAAGSDAGGVDACLVGALRESGAITLPAAQVAARHPAVLLMHGWGGSAQDMLPLAAPLHAAGYAVLLLDARCHGRSDEDSFASLPRFAEDVSAGLDWLASQPGIDAGSLALVGHSVGAGAALLSASSRRDVRALVSVAAFAHPAVMMRRWLAARRVPYWPLGAYILFYVQSVIGYRFADIAPVNTIRRVNCPVLLVHGLADTTVPVADARQIHAAAARHGVELLEVAGSHDDYADLDQQIPRLVDFLGRALAAGK